MYFKISLLFCALHFFKAAWGLGLTESEINSYATMFSKYRLSNEIPKNILLQHMLDSDSLNLIHAFPPETTVLNDENASKYFLTLACKDKETDDEQEKGLTVYEVKLFLTMFDIYDKKSKPDGILTYVELVQLFDNDIHLEPDVEKGIKNTLKNDDAINAPKFLAAILEHKPQEKGLDNTQIEKCAKLYKKSGEFDYSIQREFFKSLEIVSDAHLELMDFKNDRPAAYELQDFLVFWSDYNKEIDGKVFNTKDIRSLIWEFNRYDCGLDGLLDFKEFEPVAALYLPKGYSSWSVFLQYTDNLGSMNIVMFVRMRLILSSAREMENQNEDVVMKETNAVGNENVTSD